MTDLERLKLILTNIVHYDINCRDIKPILKDFPEEAHVLTIGADTGINNKGYTGFYADFYFDKDGRLLGTGIWE